MSGSTIEKLEYRREFFDLTIMKPRKRIVTIINNDGSIITKEYNVGSRKIVSKHKETCSIEEFEKLCIAIESCIQEADRQDFYVDDSSEELKIIHRFGRVQTMDRGLGNDTVHIGDIINVFLQNYTYE